MRQQSVLRFIALCLTSAVLPLSVHAAQPDDSAVIQSTWKPQEIRYSYTAFTTAYNCLAAETRLKEILLLLGAHPQTKVRASGCTFDRPSRNFFIAITTATPVAATGAATSAADKSEQELIDRLGMKDAIAKEPFPATWKTVDLANDRKLDLKPGECELLQGLRDEVFPRLSMKVVSDKFQCTPHQISIRTPALTVSVLAPMPDADKAGASKAKSVT